MAPRIKDPAARKAEASRRFAAQKGKSASAPGQVKKAGVRATGKAKGKRKKLQTAILKSGQAVPSSRPSTFSKRGRANASKADTSRLREHRAATGKAHRKPGNRGPKGRPNAGRALRNRIGQRPPQQARPQPAPQPLQTQPAIAQLPVGGAAGAYLPQPNPAQQQPTSGMVQQDVQAYQPQPAPQPPQPAPQQDIQQGQQPISPELLQQALAAQPAPQPMIGQDGSVQMQTMPQVSQPLPMAGAGASMINSGQLAGMGGILRAPQQAQQFGPAGAAGGGLRAQLMGRQLR